MTKRSGSAPSPPPAVAIADRVRLASIRRVLELAGLGLAGGAGLRGLRGLAGASRRGRDADRAARPFLPLELAGVGAAPVAAPRLAPGTAAKAAEHPATPDPGGLSSAVHGLLRRRGLIGGYLLPKNRGDILGSPGLLAAAVGLPAAGLGAGYLLADRALDGRRKAEQDAQVAAAQAEYEAALRGDPKAAAALARLSAARCRAKAAAGVPGGTADTVVSLAKALPALSVLAGGAAGGLLGYRHGRSSAKRRRAAEEAARRRRRQFADATPILLTESGGAADAPSPPPR